MKYKLPNIFLTAYIVAMLIVIFVGITHALTVTAIVPEYDILKDLNTYRATYNLKPIAKDERLCKLATIRAKQIQTDWSHKGFQPELDKIKGMNGMFYENLARNFSPDYVVTAWSLSKAGHREAMLVTNVTKGCVVRMNNYFVYEGYSE